MIATATNHAGGDEAIIIEPSKNKPQMLHVRGSRTYDLTKDQAIALVDTLTQAVDEKWGIDWD